jgi:hypothetical protein
MADGPHGWQVMKISLIVEGQTEKVFVPKLRDHLQALLPREMPTLHSVPQNGRIPVGYKLDKLVNSLLQKGKTPSDHVIAITDVYPDYSNATDAKAALRQSVTDKNRFHPHAAQYEFEAWLLPYWGRIREISGHNQSPPGNNPETVNKNNPPSNRIKDAYRLGQKRYSYKKPIDAVKILQGQDLMIAIHQCSELKSFVNTILSICGGQKIA